MADQTECSKLEQWSVIKFLLAEKYKPNRIDRRMCDAYGQAYFNKKKIFANVKNCLTVKIVFKMKTDRLILPLWFTGELQ